MRKLILLTILLAGAPSSANAAAITWGFGGQITFVDPLLASAFAVGQNADIVLTFESTTADTDPTSSNGTYLNALLAMSTTIGASTYTWNPLLATRDEIYVQNNNPYDYWGAVAGADGWSGPSVGAFQLWIASANLVDLASGSTALASALLPTVLLDPANFPDSYLSFVFTNAAGRFIDLQANITSSRQVSEVPEPATLLLLGTSVAAGVRRFRRRRSS